MAARVKKEIIYIDSDNTPSAEEVKEYFGMDHDVEDGSNEYWDLVGEIRDRDLEDFLGNLKYGDLDQVVVEVKYSTRYAEFESNYTAHTVEHFKDNFMDFIHKCNADGFSVVGTPEGLRVHAYHHDGSYTATVRRLTKKGIAYADRHDHIGRKEAEVLMKPGYSSEIRTYLF